MGAELPAECINIFDISLRTLSFPAIYHVPSYVTWLLAADATPVYSTHRRVLQQLQCRGPKGRWVLKAPAYMAAGHGLWDAYPEACVVQLHRDPAEVFPSLASLLSLFRSLYTDDLRRVTLGAEMIDVWGRSLDHFLAVRDQRPEGREVLDMTYVDLLDDPRKAVARIYERFGLELSPSADERMAAYLASHGQAAHGRHEYTPEQFGLNAGAVRERFASYIDRFAIPVTAA